MIFSFIFLSVAYAQWILVQPASPPLVSTDPLAHPKLTPYPLLWSDEGNNIYLLSDNMWKYEIETKRWLWMPNVPDTVVRQSYSASWTMQNMFYTPDWYYDPLAREFTSLPMNANCQGSAYWKHEETNKLYMWGGICGSTNETVNTLRAFDIESKQWNTIETTGSGPLPNAYAAATRSGENGVYLYSKDQLYYLDLKTFQWSEEKVGKNPSPPGPDRIHHTMWTLQDGSVMLYGGVSGSKHYVDTWKYDGTKEWQLVDDGNGPEPFSDANGFAAASDSRGNLFYYSSTGAVWKFGKLSARNILQLIDWKLDSATFAATIAAVMSSFVFFGLFLMTMIVCVRYCVKKKKGKGVPLLGGEEE